MDRRNFFRTMIGGVAAATAVRTWPFRVFSFPTVIERACWPHVADGGDMARMIAVSSTPLRVPIRIQQGAAYQFAPDGVIGCGTGSRWDCVEVFSQEEARELIARHGANQSLDWRARLFEESKNLPIKRLSKKFSWAMNEEQADAAAKKIANGIDVQAAIDAL